jgi:hypothetical protein
LGLIQASIEAFSMLAYVCEGCATQKQAPLCYVSAISISEGK